MEQGVFSNWLEHLRNPFWFKMKGSVHGGNDVLRRDCQLNTRFTFSSLSQSIAIKKFDPKCTTTLMNIIDIEEF